MATAETAKSLASHLPILQIVIPLMAAPFIVLVGLRALAWWISMIIAIICVVISWMLLMDVIDGSLISYHIGGWAPPLGIEYRIDTANAFVLFIVTSIYAVTLPFAKSSIASEIPAKNHMLFYACLMLCFTGLLGVTITGDAFNVFVFLEISSLSTYVLVAQGAGRDKRALTASFDYLIMGTIGATFFVIGIGLLYMATGTLNMADMAERILPLEDNRTVRAAFAFIVVGMGLKLAIYPLHLWLPNAYTFAPSAVTVFLAATATKVAVYVMMRFLFTIFTPDFGFEVLTLKYVIMPFAILAMFAASIAAVFQWELKKLLAYSSIAQIGYMLLGISLLSLTGLSGAIIHLFNHAVTKGALFMAVGIFVYARGSSFLHDLKGLGRQMPLTSAAFVIAGLSLIGVPGTAGFISKWLLVQAALEQNLWWLALMIVASSLLAIVYVWKTIEILYLQKMADGIVIKKVPLPMLVSMWILVLACIYFGTDTDLTLSSARSAAQALSAGRLN